MFQYIRFNYLVLFISLILSNETNYISIQKSISSYSKLMPNMVSPFDNSDMFYRSFLNDDVNSFVESISGNLIANSKPSISIVNAFWKGKKKELKTGNGNITYSSNTNVT